MRPRLGPVVEAEHGLNHGVHLRRQPNAPEPLAIRAARMFDRFEIDAERGAELRGGSGDDHRAPHRHRLHHRQSVPLRERAHRRHVGGARRIRVREFVVTDPRGPVAAHDRIDAAFEIVGGLAPEHERDLEALGGVGFSDRARTRKRIALAFTVARLVHRFTLIPPEPADAMRPLEAAGPGL